MTVAAREKGAGPAMQADYNQLTDVDNVVEPHDCIRLVASRRHALESLRSAAAADSRRPVLISGEPGAGKALLIRRFAAQTSGEWRVASLDLAAGMNGLEFLRLAGHPLGVSVSSRLGKARIRLQDALADERTEGRRWLLVVNQAQRGRAGVWDEVLALANQLGRPRGFGALFVVGSTELVRSLVSRPSSRSLAALVNLHIHLKPIDVDEARELLAGSTTNGPIDEHTLEDLHRKAHGNPALLLRLAQAWAERRRVGVPAGRSYAELFDTREAHDGSLMPALHPGDMEAEARPDLAHEVVKEQGGSSRPTVRVPGRAEAPALIPSKPPLRDEEGLVEVGWAGDLDDELSTGEPARSDLDSVVSHESPLNEELIEDHYAALQALSERTRTDAWLTAGAAGGDTRETDSEGLAGPGTRLEPSPEGRDSAAAAPPGGIRAEGQHEFAPYSQLFTRFRQSK